MTTQVGQVLGGLQGAGMDDNTIISFVGDHGWCASPHAVAIITVEP